MVRRLKKLGFLLGPIVVILVLIATNVPLIVFLVVLGYFTLLFIHAVMPWRYKSWAVTTREEKEWFRRLVGRAHVGLVTTMLLIPSLCLVGYKVFDKFPSWLDDQVTMTMDDPTMARKLEKEMLKIEQSSAIVQPSEKSYVGIFREKTVYLLPTRRVIETVVLPMFDKVSPYALALLPLVAAGMFAMRLTEGLGERTYKMQQKVDRSA